MSFSKILSALAITTVSASAFADLNYLCKADGQSNVTLTKNDDGTILISDSQGVKLVTVGANKNALPKPKKGYSAYTGFTACAPAPSGIGCKSGRQHRLDVDKKFLKNAPEANVSLEGVDYSCGILMKAFER